MKSQRKQRVEPFSFPLFVNVYKVNIEIQNTFIANNAMFSQLFCNFA